MEIISGLFVLLFIVGAIMTVASIFTPKTAFFLKNKTKKKAILSWLGISFMCLVIAGMTTPTKEVASTASAIEKIATPEPANPIEHIVPSSPAKTPEQEEQEWNENRAKIAAATAKVQPEIIALYDELKALQRTRDFLQMGFSTKNPAGSQWKDKVDALRSRIEKDYSITPEVRLAPASLIGLGLELIQNKGKMTSMAKTHQEEVEAAIHWKLKD